MRRMADSVASAGSPSTFAAFGWMTVMSPVKPCARKLPSARLAKPLLPGEAPTIAMCLGEKKEASDIQVIRPPRRICEKTLNLP